jgi:hypothetical protein
MVNNDNSAFWILLLFILATGNSKCPSFVPSTNSEMKKFLEEKVEMYLDVNKDKLEKARDGSPIKHINELLAISKKIEDEQLGLRVINIAISMISSLESANRFYCGGDV